MLVVVVLPAALPGAQAAFGGSDVPEYPTDEHCNSYGNQHGYAGRLAPSGTYCILTPTPTFAEAIQQVQEQARWAELVDWQRWADVAEVKLAQLDQLDEQSWIAFWRWLASRPEYQRPQYVPNAEGSTYSGFGYCSVEFLAQFGFADVAKASRICFCESTGDPNAINGQYRGIYQLSESHRARGGGTSPEQQAAYVADYTNQHGWGEWACQ